MWKMCIFEWLIKLFVRWGRERDRTLWETKQDVSHNQQNHLMGAEMCSFREKCRWTSLHAALWWGRECSNSIHLRTRSVFIVEGKIFLYSQFLQIIIIIMKKKQTSLKSQFMQKYSIIERSYSGHAIGCLSFKEQPQWDCTLWWVRRPITC